MPPSGSCFHTAHCSTRLFRVSQQRYPSGSWRHRRIWTACWVWGHPAPECWGRGGGNPHTLWAGLTTLPVSPWRKPHLPRAGLDSRLAPGVAGRYWGLLRPCSEACGLLQVWPTEPS